MMKNTLKKSTIAVLCAACCLTAAASVFTVNQKTYATSTVVGNKFTEDFSEYTPFTRDVSEGKTTFGGWSVYFDPTEAGKISLLSSEEASQYGADGQTLRINTSPSGGSAGTDHKVMYDTAGYNVKNFIATFDFYQIGGSGISSSWIALFARNQQPSTVTEPQSLFLHLQKGKGTRSDEVPTSDGGTREGDTSDIYFQYQSSANTGSGMTQMIEESGIERNMGRYFKTDGGDVVNTWFTVKYVVRDNFASCYMKLKSESDEGYRFLGKTRFSSKSDLGAGSIGFGACGGDYLIDNLSVLSEDDNTVKVNIIDSPYEYSSTITQSTASDNSDIELTLSLKNGFIYGSENGGLWYKNETMTEEVTPKSITLQTYTFNDTYGKYEWLDSDIEITSFSDLDSIAEEENSLTKRELYSGSDYRLVVVVNTAENGFNYYAKISKRKYYNIVSVTGDGIISGNAVNSENGFWRKKLEIETDIAFVATANSGYTFAGWYKTITDGSDTYKLKLSNDASFDYKTELGGIDIEAVFVPSGSTQIKVTAIRELIDGESTNYGVVRLATGEKFEDEFYSDTESYEINYYSSETVSLIAEEKTGFAFLRWEVNDEFYSDSVKCNIDLTNDIIVKAFFEVEKYRVFVDDGVGGETIERVVTANSKVTLKAPSAPVGKTFSRWVIEGVGTDYTQDSDGSVVFYATGRNIYATAYFVNSTYKVTASVADTDQGSVLGSGNKQYGDLVTLTIKPKEGYAVSRYTVRGVDVILGEDGNTISFYMPNNDVTVRVEFSVIDSIDLKKEIIAYVIFGAFIVLVTAILLFVKHNESDPSIKGGKRKRIKKSTSKTANKE